MAPRKPKPPLQAKFPVPPFSVLDARQGYWQKRQQAWLKLLGLPAEPIAVAPTPKLAEILVSPPPGPDESPLFDARQGDWRKRKRALLEWGLKGEEGRAQDLLGGASPRPNWERKYRGGESAWGGSSTSIFNPVLCEIIYHWFAPRDGRVLDPFAGGSTRGIVAARLDLSYTGIEIRPEQVEANRAQAKKLLRGVLPEWIVGDSQNLEEILQEKHPTVDYDLVFTCPPYYDLEVYSAADLSALPVYRVFLNRLEIIYAQCVSRLKSERFFVVVVGEIRDKRTGMIRGFVTHNVKILSKLGLHFYHQIPFLTPLGSLPTRASFIFKKSRKSGRAHQYVLVFVKGSIEGAMGSLPYAVKADDEDDQK
jgi:16S rRNA G966 N2-methylase RsmD